MIPQCIWLFGPRKLFAFLLGRCSASECSAGPCFAKFYCWKFVEMTGWQRILRSIWLWVFFYLVWLALQMYSPLIPPYEEASLLTVLLKVAPIVTLIIGLVLARQPASNSQAKYRKRIILGLVFSAAGDAILVFDKFIPGMIMFAFAHGAYISAFGFEPRGPIPTMLFCYITGGLIFLHLLMPSIPDDTMKVLVGVYALLIMTMVWRSMARLQTTKIVTRKHRCAVFGALIFALSDIILALDKWAFKWPFACVAVMATYYSAQTGITMSA